MSSEYQVRAADILLWIKQAQETGQMGPVHPKIIKRLEHQAVKEAHAN